MIKSDLNKLVACLSLEMIQKKLFLIKIMNLIHQATYTITSVIDHNIPGITIPWQMPLSKLFMPNTQIICL